MKHQLSPLTKRINEAVTHENLISHLAMNQPVGDSNVAKDVSNVLQAAATTVVFRTAIAAQSAFIIVTISSLFLSVPLHTRPY